MLGYVILVWNKPAKNNDFRKQQPRTKRGGLDEVLEADDDLFTSLSRDFC